MICVLKTWPGWAQSSPHLTNSRHVIIPLRSHWPLFPYESHTWKFIIANSTSPIQMCINAPESLLLFSQFRGFFSFCKDLRAIILECRSLWRCWPLSSLSRLGPAFQDSHWRKQKNPDISTCNMIANSDCCHDHSSASHLQLPLSYSNVCHLSLQ